MPSKSQDLVCKNNIDFFSKGRGNVLSADENSNVKGLRILQVIELDFFKQNFRFSFFLLKISSPFPLYILVFLIFVFGKSLENLPLSLLPRIIITLQRCQIVLLSINMFNAVFNRFSAILATSIDWWFYVNNICSYVKVYNKDVAKIHKDFPRHFRFYLKMSFLVANLCPLLSSFPANKWVGGVFLRRQQFPTLWIKDFSSMIYECYSI